MTKLLDDVGIEAALRTLPEWHRDADALVRTATLPSFPAAIAAVDAVADLAERANHHPDIDIRWRTLTFRCATHSAGGITDLDVALAQAIDVVLTDRVAPA